MNTPTQYNRTHMREQVFESLEKAKGAITTDANNKIQQVECDDGSETRKGILRYVWKRHLAGHLKGGRRNRV